MRWEIGIPIGISFLFILYAAVKIYLWERNKSVVYWNGEADSDDFRDGAAWWVLPDVDRPADEHFGEFAISKSLYEALFSLGIMHSFQKLPHEYPLGDYEEGTLIGSGVAEAAEILRKKANTLKQPAYDWHCSEQIEPKRIVYRMKVQAADLQHELLALADFLGEAALKKYAVQLWL